MDASTSVTTKDLFTRMGEKQKLLWKALCAKSRRSINKITNDQYYDYHAFYMERNDIKKPLYSLSEDVDGVYELYWSSRSHSPVKIHNSQLADKELETLNYFKLFLRRFLMWNIVLHKMLTFKINMNHNLQICLMMTTKSGRL
jgi:hypothetical protein